MKKNLIKVLVILLVLQMPAVVLANDEDENVDYQEMIKYEGYEDVILDGVVDQAILLSGKYTESKETAKQLKKVWQESDLRKDLNRLFECTFNPFEAAYQACNDDVNDFVSGFLVFGANNLANLFSHLMSYFDDTGELDIDFDDLEAFNYFTDVFYIRSYDAVPRSQYNVTLKIQGKSLKVTALNVGFSAHPLIYINSSSYVTIDDIVMTEKLMDLLADVRGSNDVREKVSMVYRLGGRLEVEYKGSAVDIPINRPSNRFKTINNFIQSGGLDGHRFIIPEVQPYLACSQQGRIDLMIKGANFYLLDGTLVNISYDGFADLNGETCKLQWDKPVYKYVGDKIIEDSGDKIRDVETGEYDIPEKYDERNPLYYLSKILDAIANMFNNLLDFLTKALIPEDFAFVSESIDELSILFDEKFAILESVKSILTDSFEDTDDNVLMDLELRLPILQNEPIQFLNFEYIDLFVHYARKFIAGLIGIYTVLHVYRKITGSGGVMEK